MRQVLLGLMLLLMVFIPGIMPLADTAYHEPAAGRAGEAVKAKALKVYGELPLLFIENQGQLDDEVRYYVKAPGQTVYLADDGIVFDLIRYQHEMTDVSDLANMQAERLSFSLEFVGANESPTIQGGEASNSVVNYFIGSDPDKWHSNITSYKEVLYKNVYQGIDLRLYGNAGLLEYDFILAPGANINDIAIAYRGVDSLTLQDGQLVAQTPLGDIKQSRPYIYQRIGEQEIAVDGAFTLASSNTYGFEVAAYDANQPIIIDPSLLYSTFLGGAYNDFGIGITADSLGCAYVAGATYSTTFPVRNAYQATGGGTMMDAFVTKIDTTRSGDASLIYSTYLGGSDRDGSGQIAVDSSGCAYISGGTTSTDFPTVNAYQAANAGGCDVFVTKLDASGSALVYSTYLGGSARDRGYGLAVDSSGCAYVAGTTGSTDFPALNAYQNANAGKCDAFITKFNASGTALVYSTYLGSSDTDSAVGLALDPDQCAYIVGVTASTDFPTLNAYQAANAGGADVFIIKLNASGSALVYSTYLGGSGYDGYLGTDSGIYGDIAVDPAGCAYVAGLTASTDFPTHNAYDGTLDGPRDAFVTRLSASGTTLDYSTYLGGSHEDYAQNIAVDSSGYAYITGVTKSTDFPTRRPLQVWDDYSEGDPFISKVDTTASGTSSLMFSTYLGGTTYDGGYGIAVDTSGCAYVTGFTSGADFPTENAYQPTRPPSTISQYDAFVSKIDTSLANNPPYMPSSPFPQHGANSVSANVTFSWEGGDPDISDNVTYDVYLGSGPPWLGLPLVAQDVVGTMYDPPLDLMQNARYYWKVVARDNHGAQAFGSSWLFFTTSIQPLVTTEDATDIEAESTSENSTFRATLNGDLTSLGSASSAIVRFVWGMDPTEGMGTTMYWTSFQTVGTTGPFSADLSGLQPGTIYWYQAHVFPTYSWMMDTWGVFKTFSTGVATVTGTGAATFLTDYGAVTEAAAVGEATLPTTGKPDVTFPHGLFSFTISDIPIGSSVTVTLTLPSEVPEGTEYWKYDAVQGWVEMTSLMGDNDGDNVLTLTLTDGGPGDGDGVADGTIIDPGGPAIPAVVPVPPAITTVDTATGTGIATFTTSNGAITGLTAAANTPCLDLPVAGLTFPHGFFSYNINNLTPGATVIITITLPSDMLPITQYWKCINGQWVNATSILGDNDGDRILTLTITDGSQFDADGQANGIIVDPGGPAVPGAAASAQTAAHASPALQRQLNPDQISVRYLSINPQQASAGQSVTITTNVVNTGDEASNFNVVLKINGQIEQSRMISVGAQGTQPVKFTITKAQQGTYNIDIGGQKGSFTIAGHSSGADGKPTNSGLIALIAMAVLILATAVVLIISLRRPV